MTLGEKTSVVFIQGKEGASRKGSSLCQWLAKVRACYVAPQAVMPTYLYYTFFVYIHSSTPNLHTTGPTQTVHTTQELIVARQEKVNCAIPTTFNFNF